MAAFPKLRQWILESSSRLRLTMRIANAINGLGMRCMVLARDIVAWINSNFTDARSDRRIRDLPKLHAEIQAILQRQKKDYQHYAYFYGYPYQSFATLGIFGERATEERFDIYGLGEILGPDDTVLDIGCNCGFVALYAAYRTGCRAVGIDINPFMIEIGQRCAKYLELDTRVELVAARFQEYASAEKFSAVFSFATHWTDDGNYRVSLPEHLRRIHTFLKPGGVLVFETHTVDVGNPEFYATLESVRDLYEWDGKGTTDNGYREVYRMRAKEAR